jgi:hypothetical protein
MTEYIILHVPKLITAEFLFLSSHNSQQMLTMSSNWIKGRIAIYDHGLSHPATGPGAVTNVWQAPRVGFLNIFNIILSLQKILR